MQTLASALLVLPFLLLGCPQPDDAGTTGGPGGVPPADGGVPPAAGGEGAPPTDGGSTQVPGDPTASGGTPNNFERLIAGGPSITISGKVVGATKAQVDFTIAKVVDGKKMAEVLQVVPAPDGTFSVKAPAKYAEPIYVSAGVDLTANGPTKDDLGGCTDAPIKLDGKDITLEIKVSADPAWNKKMPWFTEMSFNMAPGSMPPDAPSDAKAGKSAPSGPTQPKPDTAPAAAPAPEAPPK